MTQNGIRISVNYGKRNVCGIPFGVNGGNECPDIFRIADLTEQEQWIKKIKKTKKDNL